MIRVGIDAHMLGDHSGGNERFYNNFLNNFIPDNNIKVFLFVKDKKYAIDFDNKFEIIEFNNKNASFRTFFELNYLCKKYSIDILHTQYFIPFFCKVKVICTIHDICFEHFKGIFKLKEYFVQKLLIPYAAKHSNAILTVSNFSKNDIANTYCVDKSKIIVLHGKLNSIFKKNLLSNDAINKYENRFNIVNKKFILSVCNLQPRKNLVRLINAFNLYKNEIVSDIKLVIVGKKAWMYNDILKEIMKNTDNIVFTDYLDNIELVDLYNMALGFIYPSLFEGCGLPPLEAMACEVPVAVSNTSSLPEIVGDGAIYFDAYDVFDIKNSIIKLCDVNYNDVRTNYCNNVKKFNNENTNKIINDTYCNIYNGSLC